MRLAIIIGPALLALGAAAAAQEGPAPDGCAGLAPDSFEAAVLGCEGAGPANATPPTVLEEIGPAPEVGSAAAEGAPLAFGADPWLAGEVGAPGVIRRVTEVEPVVGILDGTAPEGGTVAIVSAPASQRPPPGTCRLWFPDRHSGLQRAPTSCDVEVPEGAVLIRG